MLEKKQFLSINSKQQGIALPLTLILLFAMTLLGIATLRTTTLEENMSANSRLRQIAFNAAESALRNAEYNVLNLRSQERRRLFFTSGNQEFNEPASTRVNNGDTCTNGYCTPLQFTSPLTSTTDYTPGMERWEDPILDVFNDDSRSIGFTDFDGSNLGLNGVFVQPRYIVEFLGNFAYKEPNPNLTTNPFARPKFDGPHVSACGEGDASLDVWPYCSRDAGVFRITVRANAGPEARRATVTIQSILRVTGSQL